MAAAAEELCGTCWLTASPTHSEGILPLVRAQLHYTYGSATRLTSSSSSSHLGYWRWLSCLLLLLFLEHRVESGLKCKEKIYCSCARGKKVSALPATCWMSRNLCFNGERHLLNTRQGKLLCACVPLLHLCTLWLYPFMDYRNTNYALWLHYLAVQNGSGILRWVCPAAMHCGDLTLWSTKLCQKETSF